jgi:ABC-type tungstate transport system permease subunit
MPNRILPQNRCGFPAWSATTSTQDSRLFGHILPLFKAKTGVDVKVVAQGTGQALDTGRRGDADVVFVHAIRQLEKRRSEEVLCNALDSLLAR